jgi:soluble lytic murein transglycosylase-like protein
MFLRRHFRYLSAVLLTGAALPLLAAEHVTLRNGSEFDCLRQENVGDHVRLYLLPARGQGSSNFIEVSAASVASVEIVPDPPQPVSEPLAETDELTPAEMNHILLRAGAMHRIDADLLAAVVKAESNGNPHAVSRAGAQGLMQLMPSTASQLGVTDSFTPEQNIGGGTAYLDQLLTRYHDNAVLAVAAYNAGPAAVDRYHGVPPYRETRAYVARVIREFNRRKLAGISSATAQAR